MNDVFTLYLTLDKANNITKDNLVRIFGINVIFFVLSLVFFSCTSSPNPYAQIDKAVSLNEFERGVEEIRLGQEKVWPIYSTRNAISLFLDIGLLQHYAGSYRSSSQDLQEAERLIEDAFTKSVTAEMASYIINDNTREYPGEDYEDIYINVFNALNYYHNNDLEEAMVEVRKITLPNGKLDMLSRKYENSSRSAGDWLMAQLKSLGFEINPVLPSGQAVNFTNSALARYLGALFYLGQENTDSARIEFEQLKAAFADNPKIYNFPIPKAASDAQNVPDGKVRLNIIGFAGLSPLKEERLIPGFFPFFNNTPLRFIQFKLPVFVERKSVNPVDRIEVAVTGGDIFNLELLENMGEVMKETYNARFSNMYFKTYVRTLLKYAAADIAATQAGKESNSSLAAYGSALAAKIAIDASEGADTRMARYFPDKAYIGGINLDPGTYTVNITYYSGHPVIARDKPRDVNVRANELNLIETFFLR